MATTDADADVDADRATTPAAERSGPRAPEPLHGVVVRYDERPDRCTVHPHGVSPEARTTRWLSADCGAFRSLEGMR